MAEKNIKVGDTVRILPSYEKLDWGKHVLGLGKNTVGTEFKVTEIIDSLGGFRKGQFYVKGDPADRGIWAEYVELVAPTYSVEVPTEYGLYESKFYPVSDQPYSPLPYRLDATGFYLTTDSGANGIKIDEPYIPKHGPFRLIEPAPVPSNMIDLEVGKDYWLTFTDGSRVKVYVREDSRGDIDAKNETVVFLMWMGAKGKPRNREGIVSIEEVS